MDPLSGESADAPPIEGLSADQLTDRAGEFRQLLDDIITAAWNAQTTHIHLTEGHPPIFRQSGQLVACPVQDEVNPLFLEYIRELVDMYRFRSIDARGEWRAVVSVMSAGYTGSHGAGVPDSKADRHLVAQIKLQMHCPPDFTNFGYPTGALSCVKGLAGSGLLVFGAPRGGGKTTSAAAAVMSIAKSRNVNGRMVGANVATIESPIEYVFHDGELGAPGTVGMAQMEVGRDVDSWAAGLERLIGSDYDIVFVGDARPIERGEIQDIVPLLARLAASKVVVTTIEADSFAGILNSLCGDSSKEQILRNGRLLAGCLKGVYLQELIRPAGEKVRVHSGCLANPAILQKGLTAVCDQGTFSLQSFRKATSTWEAQHGPKFEDGISMGNSLKEFPAHLAKLAVLRE